MRRSLGLIAGLFAAVGILGLAYRFAQPLALWDTDRGSGVLGALWALPFAFLASIAVARWTGGRRVVLLPRRSCLLRRLRLAVL